MVKIESYFLQLSISIIYKNCIKCNTLAIAPDVNVCRSAGPLSDSTHDGKEPVLCSIYLKWEDCKSIYVC